MARNPQRRQAKAIRRKTTRKGAGFGQPEPRGASNGRIARARMLTSRAPMILQSLQFPRIG